MLFMNCKRSCAGGLGGGDLGNFSLHFDRTGQDKTGEKSRQMEEKWHIRHVDSIPGICSKGSSLQYNGLPTQPGEL